MIKFKKGLVVKLMLVICFVFCIIAPHSMAAYEECVELSRVACYDATNTVFATKYYMTDGGILNASGNVQISSLPKLMNNNGYIYSICVYHDKIYYMAGYENSDYGPVSIYCCNIDGSNNKLLANNASNYSNVTIVDNVLYYDAFSSEIMPEYKGYTGGIYKINLNNLSWKRVVADSYCEMNYCDGDYIYYTVNNNKTYAIDVNGNVCFAARSNTDEFNPEYKIRGNTTYYMSNDLNPNSQQVK